MILCDKSIRSLAKTTDLLEPFSEGVQEGNVVSYGLTSAGYDLRLGYTALIFKNTYGESINPKKFKLPNGEPNEEYLNRIFDKVKACFLGDVFYLPPHSYGLFYSLERINMPPNLKGRCVGKSTYARCGVIINTTPLEPSWRGHLTVEIANSTPCQIELIAGEGICQLEFEVLDDTPEKTYADKGGKYQDQAAQPVAARIK